MSDGTLHHTCLPIRNSNAGWRIKTYTATVKECPSTEMVMSMHQRMVDTGEIVDWGARCSAQKSS
jgi:hypothetical protein